MKNMFNTYNRMVGKQKTVSYSQNIVRNSA